MTRLCTLLEGGRVAKVAVRRETFEIGVVTFRSLRQSLALSTNTAAPVSTSARAATPSTQTSIILAGEDGGLWHFTNNSVLASGTVAVSFPPKQGEDDDAWETENSDVETVTDEKTRRSDWD